VTADPAGAVRGGAGPQQRFADRLAALVERRESQVVLGLDPDPMRLWPGAVEAAAGVETGLTGSAAPRAAIAAHRAAIAVAAHCRAVIDAAGPACVAIKAQVACFERLGAPGWAALVDVAAHARAAGLLVLADAKRGDIDVSAAAYGQALVGSTPTPFGAVDGLGADAFTASPYLGRDSVDVLARAARAAGAGVFVLVRTSNPGAADVQDARLEDGEPAFAHVARMVASIGQDSDGRLGPLSDVGAVVGATAPEHLARARELMPRSVFLLPGIGAQGGRIEDLAPAFAPARAAALVTASRSIVGAHERSGAAPGPAARAEAERLRAAAWGLG
jgi:orotidine-5'-phosphate decarboxylase